MAIYQGFFHLGTYFDYKINAVIDSRLLVEYYFSKKALLFTQKDNFYGQTF